MISPLTVGELLAIWAIVSSSKAPGAPRLADRLSDLIDTTPRPDVTDDEPHDVAQQPVKAPRSDATHEPAHEPVRPAERRTAPHDDEETQQ